jgi:hypothetical protein
MSHKENNSLLHQLQETANVTKQQQGYVLVQAPQEGGGAQGLRYLKRRKSADSASTSQTATSNGNP